MSKVIAVFGATGLQGGSVVRSLIENDKYHVKAITRNPNSDKAKALVKLRNCTVIKADLDDTNSIDNALKDCYGVFLVTDFKVNSTNEETKQGINLIDSAIKNNVIHLVFSGSENVKEVISKSCAMLDNKAAVEYYGLQHADKINFTSIRLPAYHQIIFNMLVFKAQENEFTLVAPLGDKSIYCMDVNETGKCVEYIFDHLEEFKSKIVPVATDLLTAVEFAKICSEHLQPYTFVYGNFSLEKYMKTGFPNINDFAALFEFINKGHLYRDIELTLRMIPNPLKFSDWVRKNKQELVNYLFLNKI